MENQNIDKNRPLKLIMHTYSLHFWGFGSSWGIREYVFQKQFSLYDLMDKAEEWGLDGLHVTRMDLGTTDPVQLEYIRKEAEKRGLILDFNASFDDIDPRCNVTIEEAIEVARYIGADIVKWCLDIKRPRQLYGSRFCPQVMEQLEYRCSQFEKVLPKLETYGIRFALENHTDTFADEVLWMIEKLNHYQKPVTFLGDGVPVFKEMIQENLKVPYTFAPAHVNKQRAAAVAALGMEYYRQGRIQTAEEHIPDYLRLSQAERERAEKEKAQTATASGDKS